MAAPSACCAAVQGTPLFHIRHIAKSADAPFSRPDTEGNKTHASVMPREGETVIVKDRPSAFVDTDLEARLRAAGIETLIICGAMSQMCVDATTRAAVDLGFAVIVAADACAAANVSHGGVDVPAAQVHAAIMAPLAAAYTEVVETASLLTKTAA